MVWATPGDRDGCAPIDKSIVNWPSGAVIVMVDRGNCSFVQKVRNCEYAGAAAAIVVDNIDEVSESLSSRQPGRPCAHLRVTLLVL